MLLQNVLFTEKKMFWKKHVENPFYNCSQRTELWDIFMKTQRTYNGFNMLSRLWKIKKAGIKVNTDLYMNPIKRREVFINISK